MTEGGCLRWHPPPSFSFENVARGRPAPGSPRDDEPRRDRLAAALHARQVEPARHARAVGAGERPAQRAHAGGTLATLAPHLATEQVVDAEAHVRRARQA